MTAVRYLQQTQYFFHLLMDSPLVVAELFMIEVGATERAIIRYCKFGRRLVRDARLREFLLLHLARIIHEKMM
jgi:hypothetical protein